MNISRLKQALGLFEIGRLSIGCISHKVIVTRSNLSVDNERHCLGLCYKLMGLLMTGSREEARVAHCN